MALNQFFNNYTNNTNERQLYENLTIEMIQTFGHNFLYLPKTVSNKDNLYHEDKVPVYTSVHELEFYVKSMDNFEGDGTFFANMGLEIRNQMTLVVAQKRWIEEVGAVIEKPRPYEDDLLFWRQTNRFYRISLVDHEDVFYQFGALRTYTIKCEFLEYSGQRIETGDAFLDSYFDGIDTSEAETLEELEVMDPFAKNKYIQEEAEEILNFDERDPFSENGNW